MQNLNENILFGAKSKVITVLGYENMPGLIYNVGKRKKRYGHSMFFFYVLLLCFDLLILCLIVWKIKKLQCAQKLATRVRPILVSLVCKVPIYFVYQEHNAHLAEIKIFILSILCKKQFFFQNIMRI